MEKNVSVDGKVLGSPQSRIVNSETTIKGEMEAD
jgi:hypothetical protein